MLQKLLLTTGKSFSHEENFLGRHGPILKFTYSESSHQIRQLG